MTDSFLLAPLGQTEPGDVHGWIEHGGMLALQRALKIGPERVRATLKGIPRRDGDGSLALQTGSATQVRLAIGPAPDPTRLIVEELPAWLLGGALLLALACEQPTVTIHLVGATRGHRLLLEETYSAMQMAGIVGAEGWTGVRIEWGNSPADNALDAITTLLLPIVLWERRDPDTTLRHLPPFGVREVPFR